jgi:hypothetical protein
MLERSGLMMNHKKLSRLYQGCCRSVGPPPSRWKTGAWRLHTGASRSLHAAAQPSAPDRAHPFRTGGRDRGFVPGGSRRGSTAPTLATLHPIFTPLLHRWIDFAFATCHIAMEEIRTTGR